jgi:hypothetical protein
LNSVVVQRRRASMAEDGVVVGAGLRRDLSGSHGDGDCEDFLLAISKVLESLLCEERCVSPLLWLVGISIMEKKDVT